MLADLVGLAFVFLVVLALVLFVRQMRFGVAASRLARVIASEGGFAYRDLIERDEKGRVTPEVALERMRRSAVEVEANPDDWRAWYLHGVALGDARRPQAARAAVRRAVALERAQSRPTS